MRLISGLFSNKIEVRNEWVFYFSQFFRSLVFTIPIWIVYYQTKITPAQISILVTVEYLAQMVMELPSGAMADMLGRRQTIFLGFLAGTISYLIFPFASLFWHFLALALLMGVSDSFRSGSEEALMYDSFKQVNKEAKFGKVNANGSMIYQSGLIISTALGGIIFSFNQHLPYVMFGLALLIGTIIVTRYIEPDIDSEIFSLKNYLSQISIGASEVFKDTYTKYLSLFYIFVGGIGWASTLYFNAYMMVELGFGDSVRGLLVAFMRLLNVVVIASVLKSDKFSSWKSKILFFPAIMLFGYFPGLWLNGFIGLPFIQAAMIATTARWIILAPLTNQSFSSKYRATAISLLSLLIGVVYVGLTSLSSIVIPSVGIKAMYSLLGIITLVTVVPLSYKLLKIKKV